MVEHLVDQDRPGDSPPETGSGPAPPERRDGERDEELRRRFEAMAALNLTADRSSPRLPPALTRLLSAVAGLGALAFLYLILRLFF